MERRRPNAWYGRICCFSAVFSAGVTILLLLAAIVVRVQGIGVMGRENYRAMPTALFYDSGWAIDRWGRIEFGFSWTKSHNWPALSPRTSITNRSTASSSLIAAAISPKVGEDEVEALGVGIARIDSLMQRAVQIRFAWWHTAVFAISFTWFWRKTRIKHNRGHCGECGYDLRASPSRCPECGLESAQSIPIVAA